MRLPDIGEPMAEADGHLAAPVEVYEADVVAAVVFHPFEVLQELAHVVLVFGRGHVAAEGLLAEVDEGVAGVGFDQNLLVARGRHRPARRAEAE